MTNPAEPGQARTDWDTYWQGSQQAVAFAAEGVNHPLVADFWQAYFAGLSGGDRSLRILDVACGRGAITEAAIAALGEDSAEYECLDTSPHAIDAVKRQHPQVVGHVGDAADPGLEELHYDVVASQFGVEYAGDAAIGGLRKLVAPGGSLVLMMHHRGGSIYTECSNNLDASRRLAASNLIPLATTMFETGYSALRGDVPVEQYNDATRAVFPAMHELEALVQQYGPNVAGGTINTLFTEIANIQEDIRHYDDQEVLDWLSNMHSEMQAYEGRMQSMCAAAIDQATIDALVSTLQGDGFDVQRADALEDEAGTLAWIVVATRQQEDSEK